MHYLIRLKQKLEQAFVLPVVGERYQIEDGLRCIVSLRRNSDEIVKVNAYLGEIQ